MKEENRVECVFCENPTLTIDDVWDRLTRSNQPIFTSCHECAWMIFPGCMRVGWRYLESRGEMYWEIPTSELMLTSGHTRFETVGSCLKEVFSPGDSPNHEDSGDYGDEGEPVI